MIKFLITDKEKQLVNLHTINGTWVAHVCPWCYNDKDGFRCGNVSSDKEEIYKHMEVQCHYNPRRKEYDDKNKQIHTNHINHPSKRKLESPIFLMGSAFYHAIISEPDCKVYDLICVSEETDEVYIGSFVFGIGMFNVVFCKDTVRSLNEEEIKKFQGKNIAISNNPPIASLNVVGNKFDPPV